ncbi:MAG: GNAT family protein [Anaerolineales bacterium]|jgi:RimJ/RimL family protein N-acetyltransferase
MIIGKRIRFRAPEREDIPTFVNWINDPEVRAGLSLYLPMSIAEEEEWFDNMLKTPVNEHPLSIEVKDKNDWVIIGNIGLFSFDNIARSAEVGILIGDKTYWNKGYGTEALKLLLKHGFETLNLNRIFLRVYEDNPRAIHCYEKVGFVHEGRMRQGRFTKGQFVDILFMSVLREEWKTDN